MFWQEESDETVYVVPDDVIDLAYQMKCRALPVDHAWPLATAIHHALPWFAEEPQAGLHLIYGADSGNGWERPQDAADTLYLSRRTRLILRLPKERLPDAEALTGQTLDVAGNLLTIGKSIPRLLGMTTTLYSRFVVDETDGNEDQFISAAVEGLHALNLRFKKVLSGRPFAFSTPEGEILTRSLMVAGLSLDDAVRLQENGLGPLRNRGFGLFVPQKSV
ncbi:MAG: type I-MYXAN CRISPR-associated protein Cas6/Cmx6 [endosymbiont of Escarpia spicata]|uniref:Type I-MYXAN CRISPR-associated protein Cas6/Cmx6 n=1 Tax=endosymbiont of Escarpia spicata TaxID=2200908 RepID=A0A370DRQ1_9GAMM|nr:MAG: type I-MYXAN CRISPR-associated protein Cas6/Cmx6 [endosymbiont of Escarpia spicata]